MPSVSKLKSSNSTNGRAIKIVDAASPGTGIHQAVAGTTSYDELWIYAYNSDTVSREVTIQWGGTTAVDDDIKTQVASKAGLVLLVPGLVLQNGLLVRAYCATINVITLHIFVNRITP